MAPGVKAHSAIAYEGPFGWRDNGDLVKSNKRIAVKEYKDETTVKIRIKTLSCTFPCYCLDKGNQFPRFLGRCQSR